MLLDVPTLQRLQGLIPFKETDEDLEAMQDDGDMLANFMMALAELASAFPEIYLKGMTLGTNYVILALEEMGILANYSLSQAFVYGFEVEMYGSCFDRPDIREEYAAGQEMSLTAETVWRSLDLEDGFDPYEETPIKLIRVKKAVERLLYPGNDASVTVLDETENLAWFLGWAFSITGNPYLDLSNEEIIESGELVTWNSEELEYAATQVRSTRALLEKVKSGHNIFLDRSEEIIALLNSEEGELCLETLWRN